MSDDLDLLETYKYAARIHVNGDGFDAALNRHVRAGEIAPRAVKTIPLPGNEAHLGICQKKPWDYEVAVCIPTVNAFERIKIIVDLLRLQTVKPYILLVDCGSRADQFRKLEKLRAQDLELHSLRLNGVSNSSEVVAMAMDISVAVCQSRFLFCTHDDCFLMSQVAIQYFRDLCAVTKVCGHQLTPRPHDDWQGMIGHTALMLDMGFMMDNGLTWNMTRGMRRFGINNALPTTKRPNWPDTETGLNYILRDMGIQPFLTGTEANWTRNRDGFIDHCRSAGSAEIYDHKYAKEKSRPWLEDAVKRAKKRIKTWLEEPIGEVPPLPAVPVEAVQDIPNFTFGRYT